MKRLGIYLVFGIIISSVVQLNGQTPKLTGAFAASSGIAVDSKGNAFVTGQNNKVIKITAAGKAELFAGGGRNRKDGQAKEVRFSGPGRNRH